MRDVVHVRNTWFRGKSKLNESVTYYCLNICRGEKKSNCAFPASHKNVQMPELEEATLIFNAIASLVSADNV